MSIGAHRMNEVRAADFDALGFDELELRDDPRHWSWMLDTRMIVSLVSPLVVTVFLIGVAFGTITVQRDPAGALSNRAPGSEATLDTSWSIEFSIVPDHPLGIEVRKIGGDETIRTYTPRD